MDEIKLKPCPFCGGAGHVYEDGRFSIKPYDFPKWYIICKECGIRTPTAKMEQVVRIWNRRANVVEVVRCESCDYWHRSNEAFSYGMCTKVWMNRDATFYCKSGERKTDA